MLRFKKSLLIVVLLVVALVGTACKKRTFKADGVYAAFSTEYTNGGGPQLTIVEVTIENDKITKFYIDTIQSHQTEGRGGAKAWAFNAESKKQLGYKYGMHNPRGEDAFDLSTQEGLDAYAAWLKEDSNNIKLEWFEQAELIENYLVENGVDSIITDEDNYIDNVASVTIKDNYTKVAKEAVENAKNGIAIAVTTNGSDVIWAEAKVDKNGKFTELKLDTLQGDTNQETGKFTWHAKTKQEKKYEYGMHNPRGEEAFDLSTQAGLDAYAAWLKEDKDNIKLEWFEQADLITEFVLANGIDKFTVNNDGDVTTDALSAVTITASHYHRALTKLFNNFK